jgi:hypothetical protein
MQVNLNLNKAFHQDLHISDLWAMEEIIAEVKTNTYDFIFIDSLNILHIDTEGVRELRKRFQGAALITISQSTKDGNLCGSQEILHDSDIAIAVNEGIARTPRTGSRRRRGSLLYSRINGHWEPIDWVKKSMYYLFSPETSGYGGLAFNILNRSPSTIQNQLYIYFISFSLEYLYLYVLIKIPEYLLEVFTLGPNIH